MIADDPGAESVFHWTPRAQGGRTARRRASEGPFKLGSGEGLGVHLLTGPVAIEGAEPGDILEVRVLDIRPRPSCHACHRGRCSAPRRRLVGLPVPRPHRGAEAARGHHHLRTRHLGRTGRPRRLNYVWTPQTDPDGIVHRTIDYPGVRVDHALVERRQNILANVTVPARLHFGTMGLAPSESDFVSSIPPSYTAGISTTGASARARGCTTPWPYRAPISRSAILTPPRATANSGGTAHRNVADRRLRISCCTRRTSLRGTIARRARPIRCWRQTSQWSVYGFTYPELSRQNSGAERADRRSRNIRQHRSGNARRLPQAPPFPHDSPQARARTRRSR